MNKSDIYRLFVYILMFIILSSCNSLRQMFNIKKELKGEVTICNTQLNNVQYSLEVSGVSKKFKKESQIKKEFKGSSFKLEIPYRKEISIKLKTYPTNESNICEISDMINFNFKETYSFSCAPTKILNGKFAVHNECDKIGILKISIVETKFETFIDSCNFKTSVPCKLNDFQLKIEAKETDEFGKIDTIVFIDSNYFSINLTPKIKKLEYYENEIKKIDETINDAKEKLSELKKKTLKIKNEYEKKRLLAYIEKRNKLVVSLEADFFNLQNIINPIKKKFESSNITASELSVLNNPDLEKETNRMATTATESYNEFCNVDWQIIDESPLKFDFKGEFTYPTGEYLFNEIYEEGKKHFFDFVDNIKLYKNEKRTYTEYNDLYFVIQIECSSDGQIADEKAFIDEYKNIVYDDGYMVKYKMYPINKNNKDTGNNRLAFLRAYYLLEKINEIFPEFNYHIEAFVNFGSLNAPDTKDRPEFRYSKYHVRIITKDVFQSLDYENK